MTAAMVAGVVSPVAAAGKTFPDVDGHWSKESVYYLVEKGAIAGNDDGTFAPDREITRAEAATMMAKILNLPIEKVLNHLTLILKTTGLLQLSQQLKKLALFKVKATAHSIQTEKSTAFLWHLFL